MKRITKFFNDKMAETERTLICVYYNQAIRVAQEVYGIQEYDDLVSFLDQPEKIALLKEGLSNHVKYVSKQEANAIKSQTIPIMGLTSTLRSDAGVHALRAIAKGPLWKKTLPLRLDFAAALKDSCQHTFVIDLDNSVLEIYFGRCYYPNSQTDRWNDIVSRYAPKADLEYLTVPKLVATRQPFMDGMAWTSGPLLMYGMPGTMPMSDEDDYGGSKQFGAIFTWLENVRKERALGELDFGLGDEWSGTFSTDETKHERKSSLGKQIPSSKLIFDPTNVI